MGEFEPTQVHAIDRSSFEDREHSHESLSHEKGGNTRDEVDMSRMGKKQELRVCLDLKIFTSCMLECGLLTWNSVPSNLSPSWAL